MRAFESGGVLGRGPGEGVVKDVLPRRPFRFHLCRCRRRVRPAGLPARCWACSRLSRCAASPACRVSAISLSCWRWPACSSSSPMQAIVNMGVSLQLLPATGMTLPFVSYGGSSLLGMAIGMGMMLALTRRRPERGRSSMSGPVILAAGGTGGHLFPAIALGQELMRRGHAIAGRDRPARRRACRAAGRRPGPPPACLGHERAQPEGQDHRRGRPACWAPLDARRLLKTMTPSAVVGFGGYPTVPPLLAAQRLGLSTHHPRAERRAGPRQQAAGAQGRPGGDIVRTHPRGVDDRKVLLCGNPVRAEVAALADQPYRPPNGDGRLRVLVFRRQPGCARVMSDILPAALAKLPSGARQRLVMTQQCRSEDYGPGARPPMTTWVWFRRSRRSLTIWPARLGAGAAGDLPCGCIERGRAGGLPGGPRSWCLIPTRPTTIRRRTRGRWKRPVRDG